MPVTRRKRANPPDQPENNTNHLADQPENNPEGLATELPAASPAVSKETEQATDASAASAPPTAPTRQDNTPSALTLPSGQTFMPPPALSPSTNGERGDDDQVAGRGVATGSVRELCRIAAARHGLRTLRAATSHGNAASQKVLAKAGFVPVGPAAPAYLGGKSGTWYQRDLQP